MAGQAAFIPDNSGGTAADFHRNSVVPGTNSARPLYDIGALPSSLCILKGMKYSINLEPKFGPLELMDVPKLVAECREDWFNQTLCSVNESVVRLGILHGEFHWHKHDEEDELFFVLEGKLLIDLEGSLVTLGPNQGFMVPRKVMHRTRAPERTVVLMIERASVKPTGD